LIEIGIIRDEKALLLQRMYTYAAGKGHEKAGDCFACPFPAV